MQGRALLLVRVFGLLDTGGTGMSARESSSGRRRASLTVPDDGLDATATRILRFVRGLVG